MIIVKLEFMNISMNNNKLKFWPITALLLGFFLIFSLRFLLQKPPVWNDEAIYADLAGNLIRDGRLKTTLFKDFIPQLEHHSYWYPPMYFWLLATVFIAFGQDIISMRLLSLLLGLLSLLLAGQIFKKIFQKSWQAKIAMVIFLSLIIIDPYFQAGAVVGRMEILVIALGLLALNLYLKFKNQFIANIKNQQLTLSSQNIYVLLSGLVLAMAWLSHPNAIIFIIPITLDLIYLFYCHKQQAKKILIASCLLVTPIILFSIFWIMSWWPNKEIFWLQNQEQLIRKQFSEAFFINSLQFKTDRRWLLLLFSIANIYAVVYYLKKIFKHKELTSQSQPTKQPSGINNHCFLLICFLGTGTLWPIMMKEMWYLIYFSLTSIFNLVIIFTQSISNKSFALSQDFHGFSNLKAQNLLIIVLLFAVGLISNLNELNQSALNFENYQQFCNKIMVALPSNARVLLMSIPDPYFCLNKNRSDLSLRESPNTPPNTPINPDVYNKIFESVDYVVVSYFPNQLIADYLQNNTLEVIFNNQLTNNQAYPVVISKLKAIDDRIKF